VSEIRGRLEEHVKASKADGRALASGKQADDAARLDDGQNKYIAGKYRFVGSRIGSAEEFIKYLATGSSMSGEPYHVKCGKTDALSGAWLADELQRYRKVPQVQAAR
jgi:hypothetical protein